MGATSVFCIDCGAANPLHAKFCFACGEAVSPPSQALPATDMTTQFRALKRINTAESLQPGTILKQRYKILSQIGQGGFGAVYKAEDAELGQRLLAVKEMSQQHLNQQEIEQGVEAFKHEALLLAGLRHEHLPHIYDHFVENDHWYLLMDYIEGETLETHFEKSRDGSLPLVMALKIALQLCEVLHYLHTRQPPIIFRDLKPANIILTPSGDLFLIDFGIARHFKPGQAKDTIAFGSPGYAAPEQYGKAQTTPRADIYSLGTILHQMLSGVDPSLSPFRFAPLTGHDPALRKLVASMLEMDEQQRPANIAEVQRILQYMKAHPAVPALASAQAGQILSVAPAVLHLPAVPYSPPSRGPIVVHTHHYGVVHTVAWSADSQYIASATEAIIRVWHAHTRQNICSYREHTGEIRHMAWSPHTMHVASLSDENAVRVWDATNGKTIRVYPGDPGWQGNVVRVLAWSADGQFLAVGGNKSVLIWETDTGQLHAKLPGRLTAPCNSLAWSSATQFAAAQGNRVMLCTLHHKPRTLYYRFASPIHAVAWSSNGVYLACGGEDQAVHVWNTHTGTLVGIYRGHMHPISTLSWSPDNQHLVSGSLATTLNIWDALSGVGLATHFAHAGSVLSVAWSPDGRSILSGGTDRRVCLWQVP